MSRKQQTAPAGIGKRRESKQNGTPHGNNKKRAVGKRKQIIESSLAESEGGPKEQFRSVFTRHHKYMRSLEQQLMLAEDIAASAAQPDLVTPLFDRLRDGCKYMLQSRDNLLVLINSLLIGLQEQASSVLPTEEERKLRELFAVFNPNALTSNLSAHHHDAIFANLQKAFMQCITNIKQHEEKARKAEEEQKRNQRLAENKKKLDHQQQHQPVQQENPKQQINQSQTHKEDSYPGQEHQEGTQHNGTNLSPEQEQMGDRHEPALSETSEAEQMQITSIEEADEGVEEEAPCSGGEGEGDDSDPPSFDDDGNDDDDSISEENDDYATSDPPGDEQTAEDDDCQSQSKKRSKRRGRKRKPRQRNQYGSFRNVARLEYSDSETLNRVLEAREREAREALATESMADFGNIDPIIERYIRDEVEKMYQQQLMLRPNLTPDEKMKLYAAILYQKRAQVLEKMRRGKDLKQWAIEEADAAIEHLTLVYVKGEKINVIPKKPRTTKSRKRNGQVRVEQASRGQAMSGNRGNEGVDGDNHDEYDSEELHGEQDKESSGDDVLHRLDVNRVDIGSSDSEELELDYDEHYRIYRKYRYNLRSDSDSDSNSDDEGKQKEGKQQQSKPASGPPTDAPKEQKKLLSLKRIDYDELQRQKQLQQEKDQQALIERKKYLRKLRSKIVHRAAAPVINPNITEYLFAIPDAKYEQIQHSRDEETSITGSPPPPPLRISPTAASNNAKQDAITSSNSSNNSNNSLNTSTTAIATSSVNINLSPLTFASVNNHNNNNTKEAAIHALHQYYQQQLQEKVQHQQHQQLSSLLSSRGGGRLFETTVGNSYSNNTNYATTTITTTTTTTNANNNSSNSNSSINHNNFTQNRVSYAAGERRSVSCDPSHQRRHFVNTLVQRLNATANTNAILASSPSPGKISTLTSGCVVGHGYFCCGGSSYNNHAYEDDENEDMENDDDDDQVLLNSVFKLPPILSPPPPTPMTKTKPLTNNNNNNNVASSGTRIVVRSRKS